MPDSPCPHCGQLNEPQREVCWACFKLLKDQPAKPSSQPPAQPGLPGGMSLPIPTSASNVTRTVTTKIKINGQEYERLADVPERFRSLIKDSLQRAQQGQSSRIVVNGQEYQRLEDVPEPFRSKLAEKISHGATGSPPAAASAPAPDAGPNLLNALSVAAGYAAMVAAPLAVWADWEAIVRRNEAWWQGFPEFIKQSSVQYRMDHYHPHFVPVGICLLFLAALYVRILSFQENRRVARARDAALLWGVALAGFAIAVAGRGDQALSATFGRDYYFSAAYCAVGVALLFLTRQPGQRLTIGPVTFSFDPVPSSAPLDFDPDGQIAPPEGFQFEERGPERSISWRWFTWESMKGIFFAAMFGVPFAFVFFIDRHSPMLLLLGLAPALMVYVWLAYLVNRTTIRVDAAEISVRHGPLPWPGRDVLKADIARVMSERSIDRGDTSDGTAFEPREVYRVKAQLKGGRWLALASGLTSPEQAVFIEQQIRKA